MVLIRLASIKGRGDGPRGSIFTGARHGSVRDGRAAWGAMECRALGEAHRM